MDLVLGIKDLERGDFGIWDLFRMLKGAASRCPLVFSSATEHKSYVTVTGVTLLQYLRLLRLCPGVSRLLTRPSPPCRGSRPSPFR
jgi:hypothetical protein